MALEICCTNMFKIHPLYVLQPLHYVNSIQLCHTGNWFHIGHHVCILSLTILPRYCMTSINPSPVWALIPRTSIFLLFILSSPRLLTASAVVIALGKSCLLINKMKGTSVISSELLTHSSSSLTSLNLDGLAASTTSTTPLQSWV